MVARLPQSQSRKLVVPEVIQSSAMDCGPAVLKAILGGYGIDASYGRLREACQTDVDGTSIDTLEELACSLGLDAEQVMVPRDHLLIPEARALPAIVVTSLPNGSTHFVVAWRRHGSYLQVMDPSIGRRWVHARDFLEEVYAHEFVVPSEGWRQWTESDEFVGALTRRLDRVGVAKGGGAQIVDHAFEDESWKSIALLDASTRMVDALVRAGGLDAGSQALAALEGARAEEVPETYWSVRPAKAGADGQSGDLALVGSLLVRIKGRRDGEKGTGANAGESRGEAAGVAPESVLATLRETGASPGRKLLELLREDGLLAPSVLIGATAVAAGGVLLEALLLRSVLDLGLQLELSVQRLGAVLAVGSLAFLLLLLDFPVAQGLLRLGRRLELRLRIAFLRKLPALGERYFSSRLSSDMAERSHAIHQLRNVTPLVGQLLRASFELVLVTAGIIWLDPRSAPWAIGAAVAALAIPLLAHRSLVERDLRLRSHAGALTRFYLDGLLGLVAVRAHSAESVVQREHEILVSEWSRAGFRLQRLIASLQGLQQFVGFGLVVVLVLSHLQRSASAGTVLLLVYWALSLPALAQEIAALWSRYPWQRNVALRLLEPLGASTPEEDTGAEDAVEGRLGGGITIGMRELGVVVGGHPILRDVQTEVQAGEHVAIVGPSGSGKSTLVGLLLGWYRPATGELLVDDAPLGPARLERLRADTAWVDPGVRLWNRSLVENLRYSARREGFGGVIEAALLKEVLESLPDGMQTTLGEGGGLVSGGEGQRVRLGRGMMRPEARLVVLDEPFRGVDRHDRNLLLQRCRALWSGATLLYVTHDMRQTLAFDKVLVMESGRVVEQGKPEELARQPESRYAALLTADEVARKEMWSGARWRRLWLERGGLREIAGEEGRG